MKTLIFTLLSTFLLANTPSPTDHFSAKNRKVVWQKIYETELSKEQLIKSLRNSGNFSDISVYENCLTAEIRMLSIDHNGFEKHTKKGAPWFAYSHYVNSYIIIDFKEGKYRVTLKSIKLIPRTISGDSSNRIYDLEFFAIDNDSNQFKINFFKNRSKVLNHTFLQLTDFKEAPESDNW